MKIMQKRTGTRTTDTDWKHDIHEPVNPGSNVKPVQRSKRSRGGTALGAPKDVSNEVANRAVADRMLELFKLYRVCIAEAEKVTTVVQTELDDRAKSHGIRL